MGYFRTHNSRTDSRRVFKLEGVDHITRHKYATAVNGQFVVELFYVALILLPACARWYCTIFYCHLGSWGLSPLTTDKLRPWCLTDNEGNKFSDDYASRARMLHGSILKNNIVHHPAFIFFLGGGNKPQGPLETSPIGPGIVRLPSTLVAFLRLDFS